MRILILADIHANWPALQAIQETFDVCLFLGDLVDYGPEPEPCIQWVRENADWAIRGNHDHAVAQNIVSKGDVGYPFLTAATRPLMWQVLSEEHRTYLSRLPVTQTLTLDGKVFHLVHATPRDPMDEFLLADAVQWDRRLNGIEADFVCVGHTHCQFAVSVGDIQVVNPGSVGQPRDGDPRAAYAIVEDGQLHMKRVEYDVEKTVALLEASSIPAAAKTLSAHVLRSGGKRS